MATSPATTTISTAAAAHHHSPHLIPKPFLTKPFPRSPRPLTKLHVSSSSNPATAASAAPADAASSRKKNKETIFFDGGAHYGDLLANLLLGFTLLWLPLTVAAVFRAFYLRYRFTNLRVTVISGLTGQDRSDFSYDVVKDVQVVPRFIGEWGDVIITLKDGTKVDLRSVPKFREIAKYCLAMADKPVVLNESGPKGF
ncbi:cytochrome b6-f complex subunit 5 [Striga asiatica]|uniref:Cytochrome b6-f complex subunit 5 n=1 Tax=Striga asiatica TaxID=4170 RepID=A0A5A7Q8Y1_STRAF|nr:cytochrome b6-f complex subunit 5 [Striga asiatica]